MVGRGQGGRHCPSGLGGPGAGLVGKAAWVQAQGERQTQAPLCPPDPRGGTAPPSSPALGHCSEASSWPLGGLLVSSPGHLRTLLGHRVLPLTVGGGWRMGDEPWGVGSGIALSPKRWASRGHAGLWLRKTTMEIAQLGPVFSGSLSEPPGPAGPEHSSFSHVPGCRPPWGARFPLLYAHHLHSLLTPGPTLQQAV